MEPKLASIPGSLLPVCVVALSQSVRGTRLMKASGDYGVDSPAIVAGLCILGIAGLSLGCVLDSALRWAAYVTGSYFLMCAAGL